MKFKWICIFLILVVALSANLQDQKSDLERVKKFEKKVKDVIKKVVKAYVFFPRGGSGFLISPDGYVLSNHHVAGPTGRAHQIVLTGGRRFTARVVGHDPKADVSLLRIRGVRNLPYLELGDSDKVKVGEFVIMIGIPFLLGVENWEPTVTFGIVTAKNVYHGRSYCDAVQTDAAGNPGNSGGPLITLEGKVVGINGMIATRTKLRANTGVTYAVPSNLIKRFLPYLKRGGRVYHGAIDGLVFTALDNEAYNPDGEYGEYGDGVLVVGITEDSVAKDVGLKIGDVIMEIAGYKVINEKRFRSILFTFPNDPDVKVKIKIRRKLSDGRFVIFEREIPLGTIQILGREVNVDTGFTHAPDSTEEGVEVGYVFKNGPADKCGLKSGDIIKEVDGKKIYSLYDLKVILEEKEPGDVIRLKVKREIIPAPGEEPTVEILQMELKLGKPLKREPPPVVRPKEEKPEEKPEDIW